MTTALSGPHQAEVFHAASLTSWIDALVGSHPTPAGGALALVTLAGAAGLAAKLSRICGEDPAPFDERARWFLGAAQRDAHGYLLAARDDGSARSFLEEGLTVVEKAADFLDALRAFRPLATPATAPDAEAAFALGHGAARILVANLEANLHAWDNRLPGQNPIAKTLTALSGRLHPPR